MLWNDSLHRRARLGTRVQPDCAGTWFAARAELARTDDLAGMVNGSSAMTISLGAVTGLEAPETVDALRNLRGSGVVPHVVTIA